MKEKFLAKGVLIRIAAALVLSLVYGIVSGQFLLRFTDGLSIASVLFLFLGILTFWWKDGAFSFYSWKRDEASFAAHRKSVREARANADNHSFYAGLILLVLSLLFTLLFMLIR